MIYKFLNYRYKGSKKILTVLGLKLQGLMQFNLFFLQCEEAHKELKEYMRAIW